MSEDAEKYETVPPTKAELFTANPDRFVDISELVIAIKRSDAGLQVLMMPKNRTELMVAKGNLEVEILMYMLNAKVQAEIENKPKIVAPTGGAFGKTMNRLFKK